MNHASLNHELLLFLTTTRTKSDAQHFGSSWGQKVMGGFKILLLGQGWDAISRPQESGDFGALGITIGGSE